MVILDNFETVREDSAVLQLVLELSQYSSLLITSRESIKIGFIVTVKELDTETAVGLFVLWALDSGWDCKGDVDVIRTICEELLGNMPLAIELVATQAASLPLLVIKERIEKDLSVIAADRPDLPLRQRNMAACFNFSYERLTNPAKLLFTRLSVFVGGANPFTISEICEIKDWENLIVELVDKRLVRFEEQRYRMHPMVRRYGLEVLEKSGEREKCEQKFAEFFKDLIDAVLMQFILSLTKKMQQNG